MKLSCKLCLGAAAMLAAAAAASGQATNNKIDRPKILMENVQRPETNAFILMRNLEGTEPGTASFQLREQIKRWQIMAKDRHRKCGLKWLSQEDIARKRKAFIGKVHEADETFLEAGRLRGKDSKDESKRKQLRNEAFQKLQQAANFWADPTTRGLLSGMAYYQEENFEKAELAFKKSKEAAPLVAAFSQGHGLALLELDRHIDALEDIMLVCRLRPDSQEAFNLLKKGVEATPGSRLRNPTYVKAKDLLEQMSGQPRRSSSRGINWLMPGKDINQKKDSLPTLPYDRLDFMQAVAVPVSEYALLVDSKIVNGATELFIQIDKDTIVPCNFSRVSPRESSPPVTILTVSGYTFKPVSTDGKLSENQAVTAYGLAAFAEMGEKITALPGKITIKNDGTMEAGLRLAPGEAASPVITGDNQLAGFMANKADVMAEGGGPDKLITLAEIAETLKKAVKTKPRAVRGRTEKEPTAVEGSYFVIHAIFVEVPESTEPK